MKGTELFNCLAHTQSWEIETVAYFTVYASIGESLRCYLPGDSRHVREQRLGEVGGEKWGRWFVAR